MKLMKMKQKIHLILFIKNLKPKITLNICILIIIFFLICKKNSNSEKYSRKKKTIFEFIIFNDNCLAKKVNITYICKLKITIKIKK